MAIIFSEFVLRICELSEKIKSRKRLFIVAIVGIILISQIFILFNQNFGEWGNESIFGRINKYEPLKQASEFANQNLPDEAVYIVSDYPTYRFYLNKLNILNYYSSFNGIFSNSRNLEYYLVVDTIHSWITEPYFNASQGNFIIQVSSSQGSLDILFETELVSDIYYNKPLLNQPINNHSAYIVKLTNYSIN